MDLDIKERTKHVTLGMIVVEVVVVDQMDQEVTDVWMLPIVQICVMQPGNIIL